MEPIKVAAESPIPVLAGAIANSIREQRQAEALAIGAAAVHQALKALILANEYLQTDGIRVGFVPEWTSVMIETSQRSAIKFLIEILARPNPSSVH